ncbi:ARM repeat-containing protein [Dendrothele bispora CBS 962.96]|uniref:ARM repeat-containing protein n=1 Tax=Dendrothele bispora (strain CBS 962.96) TaxID=1314807 RepID=A0A4S8LMP9_DENBC|nr:ARM repeat-containing protein [Dendrothele bispora CBS 962.96]
MPAATSKKRSAKVVDGPAPKKKKTDQGTFLVKQKRSKPLTASVDEDEDEENEEDLEDDVDFIHNDNNDEFSDDQQPKTPKDPNAVREARETQRALMTHRKSLKPHASLLSDAKSIWALARAQNISSAERQKHIKDLMECIRGKIRDIVFKHDASRIVQTLVGYGGKEEREAVAKELSEGGGGSWRELACNKYSKFLVTKLLRLLPSSPLRLSIYQSLSQAQGGVLKLLLHREASSVLADAFELYANAYERSLLLKEFYGKEVNLFDVPTRKVTSKALSDVNEEEKSKATRGLLGILENADTEKKKRVLRAMKDNLENIFNNPDKGAIEHAIVHRALWEYLESISALPKDQEGEKNKMRRDMFELILPHLPSLVHTTSGSRAVREYIARGSAKERKNIIKQLKPHVVKMASDEEASLVLWCLWDCVDDTKLIQKSILVPLLTPSNPSTSHILTLLSTPTGRRTILYTLVPRSTRHFTPALIRSISETDKVRDEAGESKKEPKIREKEIREGVGKILVEFVEDSLKEVERNGKDKGKDVLTDPALTLVTGEIMLYAEDSSSEAFKEGAIKVLCKVLCSPYPQDEDVHLIDLPHTSRLYKTLLQGGHYNHQSKSIDGDAVRKGLWDPRIFAVDLVDIVEEILVEMCTQGERGGAFVVAELVGALVEPPPPNSDSHKEDEGLDFKVKEARQKLKKWFNKEVREEIRKGEGKGWKVLLERLEIL